MRNHLFIDHFIDWPSVESEFSQHITDSRELDRVLSHFDQTVHHALFTLFLEVLPRDTHDQFLDAVFAEPTALHHIERLEHYEPTILHKGELLVRTLQRHAVDSIQAPGGRGMIN